ncbi:hypothetical protein FA15DRAFT_611102 [Coprinopsis marcescibilis]|uniref:Arrestin-like N-terminal domain-containing protein n=1 Tax=Coprinopsis marcescibilis TaxID=230819 RepID=A0A5C3L835_COPMA|nr:hypothetical protein FA15DRAFT_611102 [Coprinopsis marcescibilis]
MLANSTEKVLNTNNRIRYSIDGPPRHSPVNGPPGPPTTVDGPQSSLGDDWGDDAISVASRTPTYTTYPTRNSHCSNSPPQYSRGASRYQTREGHENGVYHTFDFQKGGKLDNPWATLQVKQTEHLTASGSKQSRYPRFSAGDKVSGNFELNLQGPQTITSIKISLLGKLITSYLDGGSYTFLNKSVTLWDRSQGDPRFPGGTDKFNGKFNGQYSFPFSIPFPSHVDLSTLLPPEIDRRQSTMLANTTGSTSTPGPILVLDYNSARDGQRVGPVIENLSASSPPSPALASSTNTGSQRRDRRSLDAFLGLSWSQSKGNSKRNNVQPLPQSFLEKNVSANVQYELTVYISHGRFRADNKLKTQVMYSPHSWPPPSSSSRQESYRAGGPVLGPLLDPSGWRSLAPVSIIGDFVGLKQTEVRCTLSLAKPLAYARGTVIPCHLVLECANASVLKHVASPQNPCVTLSRLIRYCQEASTSSKHSVLDDKYDPKEQVFEYASPFTDLRTTATSFGDHPGSVVHPTSNSTHKDIIGKAVWWVPPNDVPQGPNLRHLEGEIHLPSDLQPSCGFAPFSIQYFVELFSFQTNAFLPVINTGGLDLKGQAYVKERVAITSMCNPDEPVPRRSTQPIGERS